jgi:iron complex outermembrane receptor protein
MRFWLYSSWSAAALAVGLAASQADAAIADIRVKIASEPVRTALIDLALQANLSLGGALEACHGKSPPLSGRMSLDAAMSRLLADSGCTYRLADSRTVIVRPKEADPTPSKIPTFHPRPDSAADTGLGEIVVTAQRYPNLPGRTPYAISAFGGGDLRREDIEKIQDLTSMVAGMTVTNLGPGRDKILLRGLSDGVFTGKAQSIVALYLDDIPITYNAPDPDLRLTDIQRVEVMRGPQGTLYGGGSIGGVVRISTEKPDLDAWGGQITTSASMTTGGQPGSEIEGEANLPLAPGKLALRAVAYREVQGGYIDDPALGLSNVNTSRRQGLRIGLRANLSPVWTLSANMTSQSIVTADTQYGLRRLGAMLRDNRVREPHENDFDHRALTLAGNGNWGRLTASVAQVNHQFNSRYDATSAISYYGGPPGPAAFDEARNIDLSVAEITYATPSRGKLHALMGAFFSTGETAFDDSLATYPRGAGLATYTERRTDNNAEAALYGEAAYELTPKLVATAGLRWYNFRLGTQSDITQSGGARVFQGSQRFKDISPKLLFSYTADSGVLVYLQAAEGYRPGGFNTSGPLDQVFDTAGAPSRQYQPDELWNYEAGAKFHWMDDRLQARVALFYASWTAIQSDQYLLGGLPFTANIGNGQNAGLEFEGAWRVNSRIDLRGAALLNDPQITRSNPNFSSRTDSGLPGVSSASAGLTLDYHRPVGAKTLRIVSQAEYVGSSHLTFNAQATHPMGNYVTFRGSISLEAKHWTLTGSIENPFDTSPNSFSFGNPFIIGQDQVLTPIRPRTLRVAVTRSF